jgi:hypothetical protein
MSKLIINIDSTSLGHSSCILDFYRTVVGSVAESGQPTGGYKELLNGPELTYGVAVHKFIDVAYKTGGQLPIARKYALDAFKIPTRDHPKKPYLRDERHLSTVCMNLWTDFVMQENSFELLQLVLPCWRCRGSGQLDQGPCPACKGEKNLLQPATEVTFSIKYYEDDYIIVNLCGTIDKIGKFKNGCYALGDWKTSGTWDNRGYFQQYELSRQLRMYKLAIKLMGTMHPTSVLGQLGQTNIGCFIDAIFLDKDPNATSFERSEVFLTAGGEIDNFQLMVDAKIREISEAIRTNYFPKTGIINGTCIKYQNVSEKNFVKCQFWDCCRNPDNVANVLLKRNFKQVHHDPLNYNDI